jgi:hypothetical protein
MDATLDTAPAPRAARRHHALRGWIAREPLRVHMMALIALAGAAGFAASFVLLHCGVGHMGARWVLAAVAAYAAFVLAIRGWVRRQHARWVDARAAGARWRDAVLDAMTPDVPLPSFTTRSGPPDVAFGGGSFGGGGAGGPFDVAVAPSVPVPRGAGAAADAAAGALDDAWPLVVVAAIAATLAIVSLYLIWIAPTLLGDLLLDGVLASATYRRLRAVAPEHWMTGTLRRTWKPAAAVCVSLALLGCWAEWLRPGADSIRDLFRHLPEP